MKTLTPRGEFHEKVAHHIYCVMTRNEFTNSDFKKTVTDEMNEEYKTLFNSKPQQGQGAFRYHGNWDLTRWANRTNTLLRRLAKKGYLDVRTEGKLHGKKYFYQIPTDKLEYAKLVKKNHRIIERALRV